MRDLSARLRPWVDRARTARAGPLGWNLARATITQGASFLFQLISANLLGRSAFGGLAILQTSLQTLAQIASVSTGSTATKFVAELRPVDPKRAGRIVGLCGVLATTSAAFVACAAVVAAPTIATFGLAAPALASSVLIVGLASFFVVTGLYQTGVLAGLQRFDRLAGASAASATALLAFGFPLVKRFGVIGGAWALLLAAAAQWGVLLLAARSECHRAGIPIAVRGSLSERSVLFRFAIPGALTGLTAMPAIWLAQASLARQADGLSELAIFAAANAFRAAVLFLPGVLNGIANPRLNDAWGRGDHVAFRAVFRRNLTRVGVAAGLGAILTIAAGPLLLSLFGDGFRGGVWPLAILMAGAVVESVFGALTATYQATGQMWWYVGVVAVPRDMALVLIAVTLAPSWGATGLALAHLSSWVFALSALSVLLLRDRVLSSAARTPWDVA